jgi:GAF domain-containing protein
MLRRQVAHLAALYVILRHLHGTLVRADVVAVLLEIVAGMIGSERLAVFERDDDGAFRLIASMGVDADDYREVHAARDPLGRLLASGTRYVAGQPHALADDLGMPIAAALPLHLHLHGRVTGGIVLFSLLPQKHGFDEVDHELFDLLTTHGAIALRSTVREMNG